MDEYWVVAIERATGKTTTTLHRDSDAAWNYRNSVSNDKVFAVVVGKR